MPAKVVDASVLGAVAFGEPRAEEAASLVGNADVYAPTLLAYELASIARTKSRQNPANQEFLAQVLAGALALAIRWVEPDHPAVLRLAMETGLTTYDAAYLHIARSLGVPLVTFDERLQAAAQRGET